MKFEINNKIGARFKLIAHKGDGAPQRETDWFQNIVLDAGLQRMSVGAWINRCCVGTGNTPAVPTQASLQSFLASTTTTQSTSNFIYTETQPYYLSLTRVWRFAMGAAAGNIAEVGMGWGDQNLWNRALIKDISGNPTTITVLNDEYLDVISEIRVYPPMSHESRFNLLDKNGALISTHTVRGLPFLSQARDDVSKVSLAGANSSWRGRIYASAMGENVNLPTGNLIGSASSHATTYPTSTSCETQFTYDVTIANGVHKSFLCAVSGLLNDGAGGWGYKFEIDPPITKTADQIMTYTFACGWGRYEPT